MAFAIVKTGGKQYLVSPGEKIKIEKLEEKQGEEVIFNQVLLIKKGKKTEIGTPQVKKAEVKAKVLAHGKRKKVVIFKYQASKRYHVKKGHRQPFTKVEIEKINIKK